MSSRLIFGTCCAVFLVDFKRVVAGADARQPGQADAFDAELGDAAAGCNLCLEYSGPERPDHR